MGVAATLPELSEWTLLFWVTQYIKRKDLLLNVVASSQNMQEIFLI